jgi:ketosteroid isomerase-like protein
MYAAVACLLLLAASAEGPAAGASDVQEWMSDYEAAFASKDLARLAAFYHADVTI